MELPISTQMESQSFSSVGSSNATMTATTMLPTNYAAEILLLRQEIAQLKTTLAMAMDKILKVVKSFHGLPKLDTMEMETDLQNSTLLHATSTPPPSQLDLPAIISELKNDIATIQSEMRDLLQHTLLKTTTPPTSVN